jgi:hypothetical protein
VITLRARPGPGPRRIPNSVLRGADGRPWSRAWRPDQSFAVLAGPFFGVSLDLAGSLDVRELSDDVRELSELPPEDSEEPVEEGEDSLEGVLVFPSEAAADLSPDSLLKAFFLASDG